VPLSCLISRQLDNAFVFYTQLSCLDEKKKKTNEETKPIFKVSYLGNAQCDLVGI